MARAATEFYITQAAWTRGITGDIASARGDTDILAKAANDIENMTILQQGGLSKRPCAALLKNFAADSIRYCAAFTLTSGVSGILVQENKQLIFIYPDVNVIIYSVFVEELITSHVQEGDVFLAAPMWQEIIINPVNYTVTLQNYRIKTYPLISYQNTVINSTVYVIKQYSANGAQGDYFHVGETVDLGYDGNNGIEPGLPDTPVGAVIFINGLFIEVSASTGNVLYGSSVDVTADLAVTYQGHNRFASSAPYNLVGFLKNAWVFNDLPKYIVRFQNRLWAANTDDNNRTIWASAIGDEHDFRQLSSEDSDPFNIVLAGDVPPIINGLYGGMTISAFSDQGVFSFINQTNTAITPTNFFIQKQNNHRSQSIKPAEYDRQLFYIQANNNNVRALQYEANGMTTDVNAAILIPGLVVNPLQIAVTNSLDGDDNGYLFVLNGNNSILCYQSVQNQEIAGWTRWTFDFNLVGLAATVTNRLFGIVKVKDYSYDMVEFKYNIFKDYNNTIPRCKVVSNPFSMRDPSIGDLIFKESKVGEINVYYYQTDSVIINGCYYDLKEFDRDNEIGVLRQSGILKLLPALSPQKLNNIRIEHQADNEFTLLATSVKIIV